MLSLAFVRFSFRSVRTNCIWTRVMNPYWLQMLFTEPMCAREIAFSESNSNLERSMDPLHQRSNCSWSERLNKHLLHLFGHSESNEIKRNPFIIGKHLRQFKEEKKRERNIFRSRFDIYSFIIICNTFQSPAETRAVIFLLSSCSVEWQAGWTRTFLSLTSFVDLVAKNSRDELHVRSVVEDISSADHLVTTRSFDRRLDLLLVFQSNLFGNLSWTIAIAVST